MRIKELGLEAGHAEKDGILVAFSDLVSEIRTRLARRLQGGEKGDGRSGAGGGDGVEAVRVGVDGLGKVGADTRTETKGQP